MEEDLGLLPELVGVLGGEITDGGTFRTLLLHLRVTLQIGMKAVGDIFALGDDTYALWKVFPNLRHEHLRRLRPPDLRLPYDLRQPAVRVLRRLEDEEG